MVGSFGWAEGCQAVDPGSIPDGLRGLIEVSGGWGPLVVDTDQWHGWG